jgi:DNA-directed RNA polymerase subunit RPC12/RpoP
MQQRQRSRTQDKEDKSQAEEQPNSKCSECGHEFQKPLFASISSQGLAQTYYACPHCLARLPEAEEEDAGKTETPVPTREAEKTETKPEVQNCQHSFGYLKKRPKETAIPETCLTCEKIIECMAS